MVGLYKPVAAVTLAATVAVVCAATSVSALKALPDIRADTNRDGVVDVAGSSDVHAKNLWSDTRGAIFLPNIGDALGRCAAVDALKNDLTNVELAACNDASGDTAISPEFFAPLRTLPISDIGDATYANVAAYPAEHASYVRVFWQPAEGGNWTYIDPDFRFDASAIRSGLRLGVDSRRVVTDASKWDGSINVRFSVIDGNASASDEVAMKLAPVLFHHHLQAVDSIVVPLSNDSTTSHKRFVAQLDAARTKSSVAKPLLKLPGNEVWVQDIMEPGYSSMPGPNGKPISVRVIVRSGQSTRTGGRQVFTQMRGRGVGAFQPTGKGTFGFAEINSGGNIETIPPYISKVTGIKYPAGRLIIGKHRTRMPSETMLTFYKSQGMQSPLILESGWLFIGHVDEFISFLPANNSLGFTISIADPMLAFGVLRKANASGFGATLAYSVGPNPDDSLPMGAAGAGANLRPSLGAPPAGSDSSLSADGPRQGVPVGDADLNATIADVLRDPSTSERVQKYASRYIEQNLAVLLQETGLKESDVIRVPTLFRGSAQGGEAGADGGGDFGGSGDEVGLPPHYTDPPVGEMTLASFYPAAINGVVIGRSYIGGQAFGPIINGRDVFQDAVAEAYKRAGMNAHFIDDFHSHHTGGGDVHCGTNTLRETAAKWW